MLSVGGVVELWAGYLWFPCGFGGVCCFVGFTECWVPWC